MIVAAGAVVVTGIAMAPDGAERGFVIGVTAFLAVVLTVFPLVAVPARREAQE
jgi:uncharacterized membrane protein YhaH (DUF805 family)